VCINLIIFAQVVISTGKTDWEKEVTEVQGTLAAYLLQVQKSSAAKETDQVENPPSGVFTSSESTRIAILNGSHDTLSDDCNLETVLVFPDYKAMVGIPRSLQGAQDLWSCAVNPALGRSGLDQSSLKSWILPYSCVIMLCSHKRRDNRCSIAAPKLQTTFIQSLEQKGWEVHNQVEDASHIGPLLGDLKGTQDEQEAQILDRLKTLPAQKKVLILRNSHIGGHKYAGNCIIHTPQGWSVWYGRVTPHEVESIVLNTIIGGKVLPSLFRGGSNVARPGCGNLHDW